MPPSSTIMRTYGRKGQPKKKRTAEQSSDDEETELPSSMPAKRPRLSVVPDAEAPKGPAATEKKHKMASVAQSSASSAERGTSRAKSRGQSPPERLAHPTRNGSSGFEEIFHDALTPHIPPNTRPKEIAKRMLGRSKTEPTAKSRSTNPTMDRTPSLPSSLVTTTPAPATAPTSTDAIEPSPLEPPEPPPLPIRPQINARTYAGKSRSFLLSLPASSTASRALLANTPDTTAAPEWQEEEEEDSQRESYADLRTRWGIDNSEDDPYPAPESGSQTPTKHSPSKPNSPGRGQKKGGKHSKPPIPPHVYLPNGMMNPLKSITELRSHGENRRFMDEVGYLMEGMGPNSALGLRRASALEITTKLCDLEFARKAKAADFLSQTWEVFCAAGAGRGDDILLDCLSLFFAALVARDPSSLLDLAQRSPAAPQPSVDGSTSNGKARPQSTTTSTTQARPLVQLFFSLLGPDKDPLRLLNSASVKKDGKSPTGVDLRGAGIGKRDKEMLTTIHTTISSRARLFHPFTAISTPLLVTYTLNALPPNIIPTIHLPALLTSQKAEVERMGIGTSTANLGAIWLGDANQGLPHLESVLLHLRLLDSYLLNQWADEPADLNDSSQATESISSQDEEDIMAGTSKRDGNRSLEASQFDWLLHALIGLGVQNEICLRNCAKGLVQYRGAEKTAWRCVEMVLRVLVSLTHGDREWCQAVINTEGALLWISRVVASVLHVDDTKNKQGGDVNSNTIKTEDEEHKAEIVSADESVEVDDGDGNIDGPSQTLDRLCLALGLLANLVQMVGEVKTVLRLTRLSPYCELRRKTCLNTCTCSQSQSILEILTKVYTHYLPSKSRPPLSQIIGDPISPQNGDSVPNDDGEDMAAAEASFLRGHLAVLFGLLMMDSPENQESILSALPTIESLASSDNCHHTRDSSIPLKKRDTNMGRSKRSPDEKIKLNELMDQAQALVMWYDRVVRGDDDDDESDEEHGGGGASFRVTAGDECGEGKVARDVVMFLEHLRDNGR